MTTRPLLLLCGLAFVGCAAAAPKDGPQTGELVVPTKSPSVGKPPTLTGIAGPTAKVVGDCSFFEERMYLLGIGTADGVPASLYRFDPVSLTSTRIGPLVDCPLVDRKNGTWPMAMSVDTQGEGWVVFGDDSGHKAQLITFDLTTGACDTAAPFKLDRADGGVVSVALGAVPNALQSDETNLMFVAGTFGSWTTPQLSTVDLATFLERPISPLLSFAPTALAGMEGSKLMGFAGGRIAEIDLVTGAPKTKPTSIGIPDVGTAMASWGGDLWLFQASTRASTPSTDLYQASAETGATTLDTSLDTWIVGAGVFVCGPPTVH
jgi:hypothetical protein